MLTRSKRHWATLLAVGLPLLVAGCAGGGMATHGGPAAPAAPEANASHMDALMLADRLKAEGNFSSAVSMYQQANQGHPNDVRPLLGLGECFLAMGSNAEAAQAYSGALGLDPNNLDALRGLGHARILLGQPQFAVTQYQTALKVAPNDTRILNGLGVAEDMMGDHAGAQKNYHQVLTLDPANQSAKNNLALSLALAGDNADGIKILEDVSKSSSATAVNRQNLALLYGASGQMAQAAQVSRADLPPDAVNRNMAAWSANDDAAKKQELLKQSLGVELKGRQYTPAAQPPTPLTNLAQSSSLEDQPLYMSAQEGDAMPVITTDKPAKTQTAQATEVVVRPPTTKDGWSEWDEQLVDATDVNGAANAGATKTQTAPATADAAAPATTNTVPSQQASQDNGSPRFLSSSNAIADDKPATSATTAASTPSTPATPSKPAATSSAPATQLAAVPPATSATVEKPAASASVTPAVTAATSAEKPAASTPTTSAAASTTAAASPATTASTTASSASAANSAAPSMSVTAKAVDVAKIYTVQIASYRSEQEASAGWQTLATAQADLLAKLPHAVAKADLGAEKGVFYRLQAGSFSDRNAAKALCTDLKNHSIDCMVVEAAPATAASTSTQQSMLAPDDSFVIGAR